MQCLLQLRKSINMTMHKQALQYLDKVASSIKVIRFIANILAGAMLSVSYYLIAEQKYLEFAENLFYVGIFIFLFTNLILLRIDKTEVDVLKSLHEKEAELEQLDAEITDFEDNNIALTSWTTLSRLISELIDQALLSNTICKNKKSTLFHTATEFISSYKERLFGIGDDYLNISIYEFSKESEELVCIACYRSTPSDIKGPHRSWKIGEGHVGKAFELQTELVCSDATQPDIAAWIAAPPNKYEEEDSELFVSLAAIPIGLTPDEPAGVFIMTSDQPNRFEKTNGDEMVLTTQQYAVASLQDIAAQLAQLLHIVQTKTVTEKEGSDNV